LPDTLRAVSIGLSDDGDDFVPFVELFVLHALDFLRLLVQLVAGEMGDLPHRLFLHFIIQA
jgi:hypothetical protein